jgi:hypothetical protein
LQMASWSDAPRCRLCVHDRVSKYYYLQKSVVVNKPSICARALKSGRFGPNLVDFDFVEVKVANALGQRCVACSPFRAANLCLPVPTATLGRKAHFVMAITSRGQGRR